MTIPDILRATKDRIAEIYFTALSQETVPSVGGIDLPQMTGVGIEFRQGPNGPLLDDLVVVVYLAEQVPGLPSEIATPSFGIFPSIRVQWRVTGQFRALGTAPMRARARPASIGLSIGPRRFPDVAGTL